MIVLDKVIYSRYSNPQGDFPEDFVHENGCYSHTCYVCSQVFTGHKYRRVCKACLTKQDSLITSSIVHEH
jgi:hypothetical protein